jgi:hypothetical protein
VTSLSKSILTKETWGYQKTIYGHMRVQAFKKKGVGHTKVKKEKKKGKKKKRKDSHVLKNIYEGRDHTKEVSIHHLPSTISIHMRILI